MTPQKAPLQNPELQALIVSGRLELAPGQRSFLSQIASDRFDWSLFFRLARGHALVGVVNHHLRNGVFDNVPENVVNDFARQSKHQGRANLWLANVLLEVFNEFKRAGISAIPYKGPVLGQQLYGDLELRASTDLDIIVQQQDLRRTRDCLLQLGFKDGYGLGPAQQEAAFRFGFEHDFTRSGLKLDLHWRIAAKWVARSLDMEAMFRRATLKPFLGIECLCLSDEDTFVALCLHAAQHDCGKLSQFVDVLEFLRRSPQLDWDLIRTLMADSQMQRILLVCLHIVSTTWHVEIPPWCIESIQRRPAVTDLALFAMRTWQSPDGPNQGELGLCKLIRGEKLRDRLAVVSGIVFEPKAPDFCATRLPHSMLWFYWVLRPLRLLWNRLPWITPNSPMRNSAVSQQNGFLGGHSDG